MSPEEYWDNAFRTRASTLPHTRPFQLPSLSLAILQTWDAEANAILRLYQNILQHRNALCIATTLPPEVFSCILRELAHIALPKDALGFTCTNPGWLSATHVCKKWRNVALMDHYLWSLLPVSRPQLWDMFVARSSNMPLTICGELPATFRSRQIADLLLSQIQRVTKLELLSPRSEGEFLFLLVEELDKIDNDLPQLETLSLASGSSIRDNPLDIGPSREFLASRIPNVRDLKLLGIPFLWRVSLPNLRSLHIRKNTTISVYEMLENLRGLKNLQSLTLDQAARYKSVYGPRPVPLPSPVILSQLVDIRLLNSLHDSMYFATSIISSPHASIHISSPQETLGMAAEPVNALVDFVRDYTNRTQRPAMAAISLRFPDLEKAVGNLGNYELSLQAEQSLPTSKGNSQQTMASGLKISFRLVTQMDDGITPHSLLRQALMSTARSEWNRLHLCGSIAWYPDEFHQVLSEAYNVQELHLENLPPMSMRSLFDSLNPMAPSHDTMPALLPQLRLLVLEQLDFDHICETCSEEYPHSSYQQLEDLLSAQCLCEGVEVPDIVVKDCGSTVLEEHVERWSEYCQVDWRDGRDAEDENDDESVVDENEDCEAEA